MMSYFNVDQWGPSSFSFSWGLPLLCLIKRLVSSSQCFFPLISSICFLQTIIIIKLQLRTKGFWKSLIDVLIAQKQDTISGFSCLSHNYLSFLTLIPELDLHKIQCVIPRSRVRNMGRLTRGPFEKFSGGPNLNLKKQRLSKLCFFFLYIPSIKKGGTLIHPMLKENPILCLSSSSSPPPWL